MLPSPKDWADMRRVVQTYFPDAISLYTTTKTFNRYGEATVTSGFVLTVSGQLNTPSGRERDILNALKNQGIAIEDSVHLTLPYGTPISYAHTVVTSGNLDWNVVYIDPTTFTATKDCLLTRKIVNGVVIREDS